MYTRHWIKTQDTRCIVTAAVHGLDATLNNKSANLILSRCAWIWPRWSRWSTMLYTRTTSKLRRTDVNTTVLAHGLSGYMRNLYGCIIAPYITDDSSIVYYYPITSIIENYIKLNISQTWYSTPPTNQINPLPLPPLPVTTDTTGSCVTFERIFKKSAIGKVAGAGVEMKENHLYWAFEV
ncbi:hypothetical protein AAMO2058_000956900 [Amorphochlora amoebiformis]